MKLGEDSILLNFLIKNTVSGNWWLLGHEGHGEPSISWVPPPTETSSRHRWGFGGCAALLLIWLRPAQVSISEPRVILSFCETSSR